MVERMEKVGEIGRVGEGGGSKSLCQCVCVCG